MKEKIKRLVNKLLPKGWQLIKWYSRRRNIPTNGAYVYCICGLGNIKDHLLASYENGEFYSAIDGRRLELVTRWRYVI